MIRKILFVDDDKVLQLALSRKMAEYEEQFLIVQAFDGVDALKKLEQSAVSLVITDLMMPRMDGANLIRHIQEKYQDLPVIILSSIKKNEVTNLERIRGLVAYLEKPVAINTLLEHILTTLEEETKGGVMHNVSPVTFMQLMEMEEKSCSIRMLDNDSDDGGILYLNNGRVMDARVGALRGLAALEQVFLWNEVTVFLRQECSPRDNVINSDIQPIIMAALARKDESLENGIGGTAGWGEEDAALRVLLKEKLGAQSGLGRIYRDEKMTAVQNRLNEVGRLSGMGGFKVGAVTRNNRNTVVLLPSSPPTFIEVGMENSVQPILNALKDFS